MSFIETFIHEGTRPDIFISDEAFIKFDEILDVKFKNHELGQIVHYELPKYLIAFWKWDYDWQWGGDVIYIEISKYEKVFKILTDAGIEADADNICSILQDFYYRKLLMELNEPYLNDKMTNLNTFYQESYLLYESLTKDIQEIKFVTNRKDETCVIKNKNLIKAILLSYAKTISESHEAIELLIDNSTGWEEYTMVNDYLDPAIINLLIYIQSKTNFVHNQTNEEVQKTHFSNKQFELIYRLLCAANIIDEDEIDSMAKDYIGGKVRRIFSKFPSLKKYFYKETIDSEAVEKKDIRIYTREEFEAMGIFTSYNEKRIKIENQLKILLNQ